MGTFQFWQKSLYPDLTGVAILLLIFLVDFLNCWKYPSNSSEIFKILFFRQNNQFEGKTACFAEFSILTKIAISGPYQRGHFVGWFFWLIFWNVENTLPILLKHSKFCSLIKTNQFEGKTACFADFSILTKIAVSRPYRRGHFVGWFFWLIFWNVENTLPILLKHSRCCSFIKTISLKQKQHVLRTLKFWPKSLYPDLTDVAILLVDFFCWFFEMLKIPFQFFWNIQNFVLSWKQSVWRKNSMFCGLFNFDQNRCIRTLPTWPFCWLIFLVDFLKCWKYPSNSSETFMKHVVLLSKQSVWSKSSMFLQTFQFWPKSLYLDLTGVAILLVDFLKCWKYPPNSSETFMKHVIHQKNQFEAKTACFADFSILTKIAVSRPYRRGHFVGWFFGWFFEMLKIPFQFFWNIQNFLLSWKQSVWSKNSMFWGLFNFDQNRCIRTLPTWPFCWLIFLVDFLKCGKYPSNSSETFKMLFFYQNNQFEAKAACFADFSILTKIAVSGPYRRGHFVSWFFEMLKIPSPILLKHSWNMLFIKKISLKQKQHVLRTFQFWPKSLYPDLTGVAIFFCWLIFLDEYFKCWKYPSYSSETFKILFFHENNQFKGKTACFADFSILTKNAVSGPYRSGHFVGWFFWLIFWNVENTLPILLKHSKCCSFIKTISLKEKQHVLRTFQFWAKSLYPDLTGVAILLVDFFGWFFEMLKIPFQFFWNIQNFVLSSKQSVWRKNSMFCELFNFDQNRCIQTLRAWPFCWLIFLVDFLKCWKYPSNSSETFKIVVLSSKQSVWSKNSMFCGL